MSEWQCRVLTAFALGAVVALTPERAEAQITLAQLGQVRSGSCVVRPTVGASIYARIVAARASSGLSDAQVLQHASSRLGFGLGPLGSLKMAQANDCTTVFVADEIARQIAALGSTVDAPQITRIRRTALPWTLSTRAVLNQSIWRQQNDPNGVALNSYGSMWYESRRQLSWLKMLRELTASQRVTAAGAVEDVQVNLPEVMLEFWLNHFNVNTEKATTYYYGSDSYSEIMRAQQGGTFASLLTSVLQHPGMIYYLDNKDNYCSAGTGVASNQNLGRELLELHTLGVGPTSGVYTQTDVLAMSSALCGWNAYAYNAVLPPGASGFVYNSTLANPNPVTVLGASYAAGPNRVPTIAAALANHASTKQNICTKLSKRFYAASLAPAAAAACVTSWGTTGNIKTLMTNLVSRDAFWSPANYRTLQRSPVELVLSVARQHGANLKDIEAAAIGDGFTETLFTPATITPQQVMDNIVTLRAARSFNFLQKIMNPSNTMLGAVRSEVGPPIGYSMDGANYLSTSYIDDASRLGLEVGAAFEWLPPATRLDPGSPSARTALDAQLAATGVAASASGFLEGQVGMGNIIGGNAASPFMMQPSQWASIQTVFSNQVLWGYHTSSVTTKRSQTTLIGLGLSGAWMVWR